MSGDAPRYVFHDATDGISCRYFDVGLALEWPRGRPDGVDKAGRIDGSRAYGTATLAQGEQRRVVRLDVSSLVQAWWTGQHPNDGLLVQLVQGSYLQFFAREHDDAALRSQLLLTFPDGRRRYVEPAADAALDCSSYQGLGTRSHLVLKASSAIAMRFPLPLSYSSEAPKQAELLLVRTEQPIESATSLSVLRLMPPIGNSGPPRADGLARLFNRDTGINKHPSVWFADSFDEAGLDSKWTPGMAAPSRRVFDDEPRRFDPLTGPAMRIRIPKGGQVGLDLRYKFKPHTGSEPDDAYFRYYLWLAEDWLQAGEGGKLPGLASTYGRAAWGDRPWDGSRGWSMRGAYHRPVRTGHPGHGRVMIGTYAYHAGVDKLGAPVSWPGGGLQGLLQPRRWYCIEQHLRLNTPGRDDGLFEVWVDGQLVLKLEAIRFRDIPDIHIEELWMNFFHGGAGVPPVDMHAYIDNIVVAREYIGPLGK